MQAPINFELLSMISWGSSNETRWWTPNQIIGENENQHIPGGYVANQGLRPNRVQDLLLYQDPSLVHVRRM